MNAPDKIYIDDLAVVNDCVTKISLKQLPNFSEYIRKDVLLEWAKDLKHIYEIPVNNHQASRFCCVKAEAFQLVIDKIESL